MTTPPNATTALNLVSQLAQLGLTEAEADALATQLAAGAINANGIASELIRAGRLTSFQAAMVLDGQIEQLLRGGYVLNDLSDAGTTITTYLARRSSTGELVELKIPNLGNDFSVEARLRLASEASVLSQLNHSNIGKIDEYVDAGAESFLVVEHIDGNNLASLISRGSIPRTHSTLLWMKQAAQGMDHSHLRGIIHRALNPRALVVDERDNQIRIVGFHESRIENALDWDRPDTAGMPRLTRADQVLGSPEYMSPEQFLDARQANAQSDIYSLGCVFFFCLMGQPPFRHENPLQLVKAHQSMPVPLVEGLTPAQVPIQDLLNAMLAKSPAQRPASMGEVADRLSALADLR